VHQHHSYALYRCVQQAKSGHPGTPHGLAPLVYTIWNRILRFDPKNPIWPNRDRFVLSNGHASMLLWSALHLSGTQAVDSEYETIGQASVKLDDIRRFPPARQQAPGHPEYHWVSGVETTTGPLGQGAATSIGMAIAEKWLAHHYNRPGFAIFDYNVYTVCGDGCLMEGIASEAASLAGHLGLDNLCWIYDNNTLRLKATRASRSPKSCHPFPGLRVERPARGRRKRSRAHRTRAGSLPQYQRSPHILVLDSHIGYGSPNKQDTAAAHGEPLATKSAAGQARLWMARRRKIPCSRRRIRTLHRRHWRHEAPKPAQHGPSCSKPTAPNTQISQLKSN